MRLEVRDPSRCVRLADKSLDLRCRLPRRVERMLIGRARGLALALQLLHHLAWRRRATQPLRQGALERHPERLPKLLTSLHGALEAGQQFGKTLGMALKGALPEWLGGAPSPGKVMQQLEREREATGAAYEHTLNTAGQPTPQIEAFVREPDAAARIANLQAHEQNQGLAPTDPRMLDALYKSYSDRIADLEDKLKPAEPKMGSTRREEILDLRSRQQRLLTAMSTEGHIPAVTQTLPGRSETMLGPMTGGQRGQVLPGRDEPVFGPMSRGRPAQMSPPRT